MLQAFVTASPRPYTQRSVDSMIRAGFDVTVSAEPGTVVDAPAIIRRSVRLGVVGNWIQTLREATGQGHQRFVVAQDDVVACLGLASFLERLEWPAGAAVVSAYCPERIEGTGIVLGDTLWGACCLMFHRETVVEFLASRVCLRWTLKTGVDILLSKWLQRIGQNAGVAYLSPSLVQHIGEVSTIPGAGAAQGWRKARDFVGEDFTAS